MRRPYWTSAEEEVLAKHYPKHGGAWDGWETLLPGRTKGGITCHALSMGIRVDEDYSPTGRGSLDGIEERALVAVGAIGEWERERLRLLVQTSKGGRKWE